MREKIFSVSIKDCKVTFSPASKAGGQRGDKKSTRATVYHAPSGAKGQSQDERSQHQNKRQAFLRMIATPQFKAWLAAVTQGLKTPSEIEQEVVESMVDSNIKTEIKQGKNWVEADLGDLN